MLNVTYPIVLCPCLQQGSTTAGIGNTSSSSNGEDGGGNIGFDLINALLGFDNAESRMTELVTQINYFLTGKGKSTVCDMLFPNIKSTIALLVVKTLFGNHCR